MGSLRYQLAAAGLALCAGQPILHTRLPAPVSTRPKVATSPGIVRDTLANGLGVVIVRDALAPMVTTQITYLTGGYETPQGFPGTAHALEHMMFRDSKGMSGAQLDEIVGKMGGSDNAFTTNDATQYYFVAPAAYLDVLLHIEAARMRGALLTGKGWDLEKGAIEQEVSRDISGPGYLAFEQAEAHLYAGTGYQEDPLRTRPSFDNPDFRRFYDHWYRPNNAVFVIVGDVDPLATLSRVKQLFGAIPGHATPARAPVALGPVTSLTIRKSTPAGTGTVEYLYRMPGERSKDYAAAEILMDVLNNARSALSGLQVQGRVLASGAGMQPFSYGGIGIVSATFPKGDSAFRTQAALDSVLTGLLRNGVDADLGAAAKRSELSQSQFNRNSAVSLASEWSQALAWQGLDSPAQADSQIRAITVNDVNRVAHEYLQPSARVTVILTPSANGKRPPNSAGFGGNESFGSNDKLDVPLPGWASSALARLEMPHWTLAPVRMHLDNGITLIVQPEAISHTVTVVGHVDNNPGLEEPRGQFGVGGLLGSLFDYGTTTLNRPAFHKALDAIAATEYAGATFGLAVPSADFDQGMRLLSDNELHPALPATGFVVQRNTMARALAGQVQTPGYKMGLALRTGLLPAGDPALRHATVASVSKRTFLSGIINP